MKIKLAILFGGITPEHEVSIITAVQLMNQVDQDKYLLKPIYVDKSGQWWTGEALLKIDYYKNQNLYSPQNLKKFILSPNRNKHEIDVALLCFHGNYGEGGNVQGLLEMAGIPYQGPELVGSAISMDKIVTRQILKTENIPQPNYIWFNSADWENNKQETLEKIKQLPLPVFIKSAKSGSSIGVTKVENHKGIDSAVKTALSYDNRVIVDQGITDFIEVNISVLGNFGKSQASVSEQPLQTDEILSFADKYERGSGKKSGMANANRRIPAPISSSLQDKLQNTAQKIFKIFDLSGVVRIDFLANPSTEEFYLIEINTIPGSMSFYLWQATNLEYKELIEKLIKIALENYQQKIKLTTSFKNNILER